MLIPRIGMPGVLFCARPAASGIPAIIRPAQLIAVQSYGPNMAIVNLQVFTDGPIDVQFFNDQASNGIVRMTSVEYDRTASRPGTFCYFDERAVGPQIEELEINNTIRHGREIVKKGAIGIWDQLLNQISFDREQIEGMGDSMLPQFDADIFIDQHIARITLPKGYAVVLQPAPLADNTERPGERQQYMRDLMDEWRDNPMRTPWPSSVERRWYRGEQIQEAIEEMRTKGEIEEISPDENKSREKQMLERAAKTGRTPLISHDESSERTNREKGGEKGVRREVARV